MFDLCCQNQGAEALAFFAENHPDEMTAPRENPFLGTMYGLGLANAAKKGNTEAFNYLLDYRSADGTSLLERLKAKEAGYVNIGAFASGEIVQKAIDAGVDPNEEAVLSGMAKALCGIGRTCFRNGVGADSFMVGLFASLEGQRPLHVATAAGNFAVVEVLLRNGADPRLRNALGQTALDLGESKQQERCCKLLRSELKKWPAPVQGVGWCAQEELPEASPALIARILAEHEGKRLAKRGSKDSVASTAASSDSGAASPVPPVEIWC